MVRAGEIMGQSFGGSRDSGGAGLPGEQGFWGAGLSEQFVLTLRKLCHQAVFPPLHLKRSSHSL